MKKRVKFNTVATVTVEVDIPSDIVEEIGENQGQIREYAIDQAYDKCPTELCGYCSGYNQYGWSVELGHIEFGMGFMVDPNYEDTQDVVDEL